SCPSARSAAATFVNPFFDGDARKPWTRTIGYCVARPDGVGPIAVSASSDEEEEEGSSVGAAHAKSESDDARKRRESFMERAHEQRVCLALRAQDRARIGQPRHDEVTPWTRTSHPEVTHFGPPVVGRRPKIGRCCTRQALDGRGVALRHD